MKSDATDFDPLVAHVPLAALFARFWDVLALPAVHSSCGRERGFGAAWLVFRKAAVMSLRQEVSREGACQPNSCGALALGDERDMHVARVRTILRVVAQ